MKQRIAASAHAVKDRHLQVFSETVVGLGVQWRDCEHRPKIDHEVLTHWSELLEQWIAQPACPLLVRKHRRNRGHRLVHYKTQRIIIPCDNAAANWIFYQALSGRTPTIQELQTDLDQGDWPLAQVLDAGYQYAGSLKVCPENLNSLGWKICHLVNVALGGRGALEDMAEPALCEHSRRFLDPANMILVPKAFGGVAESPDFLAAFLGNIES